MIKLCVGAIGIVYGDIGTSPIYAFRETFAGHHGDTMTPDALHIYGVLSLIFWSMMIVVAFKYVTIILRADNKGEGGSLALLALISRTGGGTARLRTPLIVLLGVFACALFYGDSMITPAVSVLSAVEGLKTVDPRFGDFVLPIAGHHPGRAVRDPIARHGPGRCAVRSDHADLLRDAVDARHRLYHAAARHHPGDDQPDQRGLFFRR
jgi:K+ transporter